MDNPKVVDEESQTPDGNVVGVVAEATVQIMKKALDMNKYATKKTIAQGLLDVALLTANASQLKYVLQVIQAVLCVLLGSALNLNNEDHHGHANRANNIIFCVNIVIMAVNILIGGFEVKEYREIIDNTSTTAATTLTP